MESKIERTKHNLISYIIEVGHNFFFKVYPSDYELRYFSVCVHKMIYIYVGMFAQVKFPMTIFIFSQKKAEASALFVV